jgi:hypothetical protein
MRPWPHIGEMRPAARGPANSVLCVSRALDRFESRTWKLQLACRPQPRQHQHSLDDAARCTRGIASKQTPCVCMRAQRPEQVPDYAAASSGRHHRTYCVVGLTVANHCARRRRPREAGGDPGTEWRPG